MKARMVSSVLPGLVVGVLLVPTAFAANRFVINNQSLPATSTGNDVKILADLDQDTYAFSVSLQFDGTKLAVTQVDLGADSSALSPEYSHGTIVASPGSVTHGVVFDLSDPITKKLSPGTGKEILILKVDVKATQASTTVMDLVNVPGNPARINVMTNANGESVSPAPTLVDGTMTISVPAVPVIESFLNNSGCAGKEFLVVGQNFVAPGFRVNVCGVQATATILGDQQTVRVTAPNCGSTGWAVVEVCNDLGCDNEAQGFLYSEDCTGTPFVRGNANNDAGVDITDGIVILGDLFLGNPASAPCRDALDTNDNGTVDISDAIYLLNFLFLGGPNIPPPYPSAGLDPTEDPIPAC